MVIKNKDTGFTFKSNRNKKRKVTKIIPPVSIIVLITIIIFFGILNRDFLSLNNFIAILMQSSILLVTSVGLTFVLLIGSIDLSIEGIMSLTGSIISLLVLNNKTTLDLGVLGIVITLTIGAFAGFINGLIHVKVKLPSFIVSFCVGNIAAGIALLSYRGIPATIRYQGLRGIVSNSFIGLPNIIWIALIVFVIGYNLQENTVFGQYIFAIGSNEVVCRRSGINVDKIKIFCFVLSGLCAGLGGILGAARLGRGIILIGKDNLLPALAAVVIGGTSLSGGKGGVLNTLFGVLIITILQNGLILINVDPYFQSAVQGIMIILAVIFSQLKERKIIIK